METMGEVLRARVRFLETAEGGRLTPPADGFRPHIKLGPVLSTCIVHARCGDTIFELGRFYEVDLDIVFWNEYGYMFQPDCPIELFEGSRLIGLGEIVHVED